MNHRLNTDGLSADGATLSDRSIVPSVLTSKLIQVDAAMWRWELAALTLLIAVFNLPLMTGGFSTRFIFHHEAVAAGEWWRVLTHPFVHVSLYHLALDAAAFFLAYIELKNWRLSSRLALLTNSAAGGLLGALAASPAIFTNGLCGLSGIAHGLTAVVSLELLRSSSERTTSWTTVLCFIGVVAKSVIEAATGQVMFASWHLGSLGTPIAACHAGGVLGALVAWFLLREHTTKEPMSGRGGHSRTRAKQSQQRHSSECESEGFRLTSRSIFGVMDTHSHDLPDSNQSASLCLGSHHTIADRAPHGGG